MHAERGFTLIEILVVVAIIGITLGFAMLAFGDFGASRRAVVSAEQFSSYIKLVQQQAIIETSTLGINLANEGYSTYRFESGGWQMMPAKSIFHWRSFPSKISVTFRQGGSKNKLKNPDIIITPAGDMSEFIADFGTSTNTQVVSLIGNTDGRIIIEKPK
ncbi:MULTISPECIES: type II secretion system minor pseudopilin GspH [Legionella]|uniref:Type II secretion system protein H n=1 Tax=Legionella drozanskii LLAP-1 TaxID=1212489 RepID=A0A0W0TBL4_9GAMM|nr:MULTISPECIES: type II secretion system minor pseudopilin GspH [Legionella]KTC92953.1 general secretion pathway protein LspH [Legionella drozanskii LLAP-1]PJE13286.1 MAG: prepilin-type cleavage/methylation domain-containing protein [Legionella sp.]